MAQYEEFSVDKGTDIAIEIHMLDANGNTKNLTNHSVSASLKRNYSSEASVDFNSIIANPAVGGIATISLTNSDTNALQVGRYVYDVNLSFVDSDGNSIVERVLEGRFQVTPNVTQAGA
tara:strand:+ start:474 stop:830 length:357 start_codon:yes stop_codon:yes gene_type:complete